MKQKIKNRRSGAVNRLRKGRKVFLKKIKYKSAASVSKCIAVCAHKSHEARINGDKNKITVIRYFTPLIMIFCLVE